MDDSQTLLRQAIGGIASDQNRRVYAVIDGAPFDDLPALLVAHGVAHRSLFTRTSDFELVRAGPWLVDPHTAFDAELHGITGYALEELSQASEEIVQRKALKQSLNPAKQLSTIIDIAGTLPVAVFWAGSAGLTQQALWRHLRTINKVLIPREAADIDPVTDPAITDPSVIGSSQDSHEAALFRHADGNVLAQVLPVLDEAQFARVFGPADLLVFLAPDHPASDGSIMRRAVRSSDVQTSPGMLRLGRVQIADIVQARTERSRRRIAGYLRKVAPEQAGLMSDRKLEASTSRWMEEASSYGIQSEAAHGRWCYMQLCADGKLTGRPEIRSAFSDTERTPDMVVSLMLKEIVREMRRAGL